MASSQCLVRCGISNTSVSPSTVASANSSLTVLLPIIWGPALVFLLREHSLLLGIYLIPTTLLFLLSSLATRQAATPNTLTTLGLQVAPVWILPSLVLALVAVLRFPPFLPAYACMLIPALVQFVRPGLIPMLATILGCSIIAFLCNWLFAAPAVTTPHKLQFAMVGTLGVVVCAMPCWTFAGYWKLTREQTALESTGWIDSLLLVGCLVAFIGLGVVILSMTLAGAWDE